MIREDRRRGVFVDGLSEWVVRSPGEVYGLMMRGAQQVRASVQQYGLGHLMQVLICVTFSSAVSPPIAHTVFGSTQPQPASWCLADTSCVAAQFLLQVASYTSVEDCH